MHADLKEKGFEVLAFPSNQFGKQEPGSAEDINAFARDKYGAQFPIHEKIDVNGKNTHVIFNYLRSNSELQNEKNGRTKVIPWNFAKFLVDNQTGKVNYYPPTTDPDAIRPDIESKL